MEHDAKIIHNLKTSKLFDDKIHKMKTISSKDAIERLKKGLNLSSDNALAELLGISKATLSNWKSRNSIDIPLVFSKCEQISIDWLLTGHGPMLKMKGTPDAPAARDGYHSSPKDKDKITNKQGKEAKKNTNGIPLIPLEAVAGFPATDNEVAYLEDCERYTIPEFEAKGANFLIRVSGDSMMPLYNNGDIIACRKIHDILFFQWGGVYVLETSQGVIVKYVEEPEKNDDCILCVSENPRFKPFQLPKSDIRSLSTIIGLVRLV